MPKALSHQLHAYIYVIGYRNGLVKIGFSLWPERRRDQLSARYGIALKLLGDMQVLRKHAAGTERLVHTRLHKNREDGEWFSVTGKEALGAVALAALDYELGVRVIRPPPKPAIGVFAPLDLIARIEEWRADQRPIPNKSEAARMLIERGLLAERRASKKATKPD